MGEKAESERGFPVIDGLRSLLTCWVVACHVIGQFLFVVHCGSPQDPEKRDYLATTWWSFLAQGLGYQVDVFFLISGFLTTYGFLHKKSHYSGSLLRDVPLFAIRRLLRLWPMVLVQVAISYLLSDYRADDWQVLLSAFAFPISPKMPAAFVVAWSTRVDLICTFLLLLTITAMDRLGMLNFRAAAVVATLSLIPAIWRFLSMQDAVSYTMLRHSGNPSDFFIPVFMTVERQTFLEEHLYPGSFDYAFHAEPSARKYTLISLAYSVWHQRMTPFFVGMALAFALRNKASTSSEGKLTWLSHLRHGVLLCLAWLNVLQPVLLSLLNKRKASSSPYSSDHLPPLGSDLFLSVFHRQLFALSFAYLLYCALLPATHVYHLRSLHSLLGGSFLSKLGKYSYGVFALHMVVLMEVMFRYFPPRAVPAILGTENPAVQFVFLWMVTYLATLAVAVGVFHAFEEPVQRRVIAPIVRWMDGDQAKKIQ